MRQDIINGQAVEACIISGDGTELAEGLTPAERKLLAKIDSALRADARFGAGYPEARLVRIDSNRGQEDREAGRFYLRYQYQGGMAEFWGNVGEATQVDCGQGIVTVMG